MRWSTVPLNKVANLESGFGFPRDYQGDENQAIPFFRVSDMNIEGNEVFMENHSNTVSTAVLRELGARAFPPGTVIFPKIGAAIATEKKRILTKPATYDNNVMGAVPKGGMNSKFLYYWFLQLRLADQANPGHVPSIRKSVMEGIPFPLVAPTEQARIVELLDEADRLRRLRREADAKAARILPALFLKMFGDPLEIKNRWHCDPISVFADVKGGKRLPKGEEYAKSITPHRYIRGVDIQPNLILRENLVYLTPEIQKQISRYVVSKDDVVITIAGKIGVCAPVPASLAGMNLTENAARIVQKSPDSVDPMYLSVYLNSPAAQAEMAGHVGQVTIAKLALFRIEQINVPRPPLELQKTFSRLAQQLDASASMAIASGAQLERLFDLLLQRAFSGQLTAKWREAHMKELLAEMQQQARALNLPMSKELEAVR